MAQWKIYYRLKGTASLNTLLVSASNNSDARRLAQSILGPDVEIQRVTGA